MKEPLFESLCREYEENIEKYNIDIDDLCSLLEFFRILIERNSNKTYALWIGKILKKLIEGGKSEDAVWFFIITNHIVPEIKTAPNLTFLFSKDAGEDTRGMFPHTLEMEVTSQDSREYHSRQYIKDLFIPNINIIGIPLLKALTNELLDVKMSLKRMSKDKYLYMSRKTIEDHDQNIYKHDMYNFLIDIVRDVWKTLLDNKPEQAIIFYQQWSQINDEIFKRLSLHAARLILEKGYAE